VGPGRNDDKSVRILNRIVTWHQDGIKYEADQRHAVVIISQLGLKGSSDGVSTPGTTADEEGGERKVGNKEATQRRGLVARANHLCQDRSGIQVAVKELCRKMSEPHQGTLMQRTSGFTYINRVR